MSEKLDVDRRPARRRGCLFTVDVNRLAQLDVFHKEFHVPERDPDAAVRRRIVGHARRAVYRNTSTKLVRVVQRAERRPTHSQNSPLETEDTLRGRCDLSLPVAASVGVAVPGRDR